MAKQKPCLENELSSYTNGIVVKDEMVASEVDCDIRGGNL